MFKLNKLVCVFLLAFAMVTLSNCGANQPKNEIKAEQPSPEAVQLLTDQNALYEVVCRDFSDINQKVMELNSKIRSMTGKLTEEQNAAIDEIEAKRTSISTRMKTVKTIPQADWENFKSTLEQDISDTQAKLDKLLSSIK
ncbi:MAG TPA: hypothetical protein PK335_08125 [Draconibacterium sp.]|nr:hypothetical protein [Draconibacterium sp.]